MNSDRSARTRQSLASGRRGSGMPCDLPRVGEWETRLAAELDGLPLAADDGDGKVFGALYTYPPTGLVLGAGAWSRKLDRAKRGATLAGPGNARSTIFAGDFSHLYGVAADGAVVSQARSRSLPLEVFASSLDAWLDRYAVHASLSTMPIRATGTIEAAQQWPEQPSPHVNGPARWWDEDAWAAECERELVVVGFDDVAAVLNWQPSTRTGFLIETAGALEVRPFAEAPKAPHGGWPHPRASGGRVVSKETKALVEQVVSVDGRVLEEMRIAPSGCTGTSYVGLTNELDDRLPAATIEKLRAVQARIDIRYRTTPERLAGLLGESSVASHAAALERERDFAGLYIPGTGFLVGIAAVLDQDPRTVPWPEKEPRAKEGPLCPIAVRLDESFWMAPSGTIYGYSHAIGRLRKFAAEFSSFVAKMLNG